MATALCWVAWAQTRAGAQSPVAPQSRAEAAAIVGAEACGDCHFAENQVWKKTPHATGFKTLHRKKNAEAIAERMGFWLIKRDSLCIRCHYTPTIRDGQLRALSGVSCESCHGPGRDWINVHNDYGAKGVDYSTETAEHREQRIAQSVAAGMRRPSLLYDVAKSCFGCHLVTEERLVNEGEHSIGSGTFELVEWSGGEIRHNFLEAQRGGDIINRERSAETKRVMYVVGRAAELETVLRAVAKAENRGVYLKAMQRRARNSLGELREIAQLAELTEIDELLRVVRGVKVDRGNAPALVAAADQMSGIIERLVGNHDGSRLAALDELRLGGGGDPTEDLPPDQLTEQVDEPGAQGAVASGAPADVATGEGAIASSSGDTPVTAGDLPGSQPGAAGEQAAVTPSETRTTSRPSGRGSFPARSSHRTLGAACSSCHASQNEWWFDDPHYASVDPFFDEEPDNVKIARLYGIKPEDMTRGNQTCMRCHGTVISGRERRIVQDGVGCESCHGAAGDYIEAHQEGDKSLGASRPGYLKALELGMVELQKLDTRAATCTGCHYVTDGRLISAGHPSGQGFDFIGGMAQVRHWDHVLAPNARLASAFSNALSRRGAVPNVAVRQATGAASIAEAATGSEVVDPVTGEPTSGPSSTGVPAALADSGGRPGVAGQNPNLRAVAPLLVPRPAGGPDPVTPQPAARPQRTFSAFPEINNDTSIEEILILVKTKLESLHSEAGDR